MSDPNAQEEPSMEEILASIRRIISEDETEGEETAETAEAEAEPPPPAEEEPVDEPVTEEPVASEPEETADVFELTQEVQDDGSVIDIATGQTIVEAEPPELEEVEDFDEPEPPAFQPEPAPAPEPRLEPIPAAAPSMLSSEGLVGPTTDMASTGSFTTLAQSVVDQRLSSGVGIGGKTVEEVVKEVMRPMIKEWLDANLAELVERLVKREIDRMSRRAEENADP